MLEVTLLTLSLCTGTARAAVPTLSVQPYLQAPSATSMTVVWWTDTPSNRTRLRLWPADGGRRRSVHARDSTQQGLAGYRHEVELRGLSPGSRWHYQVRANGGWTSTASFSTLPDDSDAVHIAFLGDGRTDDDEILARHRTVLEQAARADLVVELGDTVALGDDDQWRAYLTGVLSAGHDDPAGPGSHTPTVHVVGNHELASTPSPPPPPDAGDDVYYAHADTAAARFREVVVLPTEGVPDDLAERCYELDAGPVTLIALDLNNTSDDALDNHDLLADGSTPDWEPGSAQHAWLLGALDRAQRRGAFTVVVSHPSPYSPGVHGTDDPDIDAQRGYELRSLMPTLLARGVDAFVSSHDHLAAAGVVGPAVGPGALPAAGAGADADALPRLDPRDAGNMLVFVMGDSGAHSRSADPRAAAWMAPSPDDPARFAATWVYDWPDTDVRSPFSSHLVMDVAPLGGGRFAATFAVVRTDGARFAETRIERSLPDPGSGGAPPGVTPGAPPPR